MELSLGRPFWSSSAITQIGLGVARNLHLHNRVSQRNRPFTATADLSDHLRRDIGLNPSFATHHASQPHTWRI